MFQKNQWENPRFGEPSSGGNLPLKITLESPPVFQKMGDGLNLPKPVLNTENPRLFTRCFLGFEGDVLRIRSHGKSQCFTTIWEKYLRIVSKHRRVANPMLCHGDKPDLASHAMLAFVIQVQEPPALQLYGCFVDRFRGIRFL